MSEEIDIVESDTSTNPAKRKAVDLGDLDDLDQSNLRSAEGAAENFSKTARKRKRLESDNVAGNPMFGGVDEPSLQPGTPFEEGAEELQGNLVTQGTPILSGGYADIFRGIWKSPNGTVTDVAVKTLKPIRPTSMSCRPDPIALQKRREKRLRREVAVWARLVHSNIHPLLGFRTQPEPCLVSQWCENGNLAIYLDNNPSLSRPDKLRLLAEAAHGLEFLHSQSPPICHGDIKPENVLVNGLCEAALSDFGLSRVIQEFDASTGWTTGDGAQGTQRYMAPELFLEQNPKPTLGTDVYAFGGLTLAVMSGSPPFFQINAPGQVLFRIVREEHPRPDEHPTLGKNDRLWSLMRRCWAREPPMRPIMGDVKIELGRAREPPIRHQIYVLKVEEQPGNIPAPAQPQPGGWFICVCGKMFLDPARRSRCRVGHSRSFCCPVLGCVYSNGRKDSVKQHILRGHPNSGGLQVLTLQYIPDFVETLVKQ